MRQADPLDPELEARVQDLARETGISVHLVRSFVRLGGRYAPALRAMEREVFDDRRTA